MATLNELIRGGCVEAEHIVMTGDNDAGSDFSSQVSSLPSPEITGNSSPLGPTVNRQDSDIDAMPGEPPTEIDGYPVMAISAKTGDGVGEVVRALEEKVAGKIQSKTAPLVTRQRHRQALAEAGDALCRFLDAGAWPDMPELAAEDLRLAGRALGRITGTVDVEDILEIIFADFCIGK